MPSWCSDYSRICLRLRNCSECDLVMWECKAAHFAMDSAVKLCKDVPVGSSKRPLWNVIIKGRYSRVLEEQKTLGEYENE